MDNNEIRPTGQTVLIRPIPTSTRGIPHVYFDGTDEFITDLRDAGVDAKKTHPDAEEGVVHFDAFWDFPALYVAAEAFLNSPWGQFILGVAANAAWERIRKAKQTSTNGEMVYLPQFNVTVDYDDGRTVTVRCAGEEEVVESFGLSDLKRLFDPDYEPRQVPLGEARYVSWQHRDVFHRPTCFHVRPENAGRDDVKLIGYPAALDASREKLRPCNSCKPPWVDSD